MSNSLGALFDLGQVDRPDGISPGMIRDGARRADEFAELAGDAAFATVFVRHQRGRAAIVIRQVRVPFLLGILHRHFGPAGQHVFEMAEGDRHPAEDGGQVDSL